MQQLQCSLLDSSHILNSCIRILKQLINSSNSFQNPHIITKNLLECQERSLHQNSTPTVAFNVNSELLKTFHLASYPSLNVNIPIVEYFSFISSWKSIVLNEITNCWWECISDLVGSKTFDHNNLIYWFIALRRWWESQHCDMSVCNIMTQCRLVGSRKSV